MKGRVLVVDDDAALSEMIGIMLRGEGFDPMFVADGDHAVQAFRDTRPDLVLLDLMLPGLDGIDVCRQIRTESGVPIVMLTAKSDTVDVVLGLESGADDYIVKPFKFDELRTRVHAGIRVASLQERVATSVAELQAVHQVEGVASASSISAQARRGWLKLAKDGVARSARYRRSLGDLVQAAAEGTRQQATDADSPRDPALTTGAERSDDTLLNRSSAPIDIIDR
jgi:DNA-binding response OmpR family regulator